MLVWLPILFGNDDPLLISRSSKVNYVKSSLATQLLMAVTWRTKYVIQQQNSTLHQKLSQGNQVKYQLQQYY